MTDQELMEQCINECFEVIEVTSRCVDYCLQSDRVGEMTRCIRLCLDGADIAGACARMMARNSQFGAQVCGICADVCDACAEECEKFEGDIMRECVDACRRCAETCRQMAMA